MGAGADGCTGCPPPGGTVAAAAAAAEPPASGARLSLAPLPCRRCASGGSGLRPSLTVLLPQVALQVPVYALLGGVAGPAPGCFAGAGFPGCRPGQRRAVQRQPHAAVGPGCHPGLQLVQLRGKPSGAEKPCGRGAPGLTGAGSRVRSRTRTGIRERWRDAPAFCWSIRSRRRPFQSSPPDILVHHRRAARRGAAGALCGGGPDRTGPGHLLYGAANALPAATEQFRF